MGSHTNRTTLPSTISFMLSKAQKKQIIELLALGFTDPHIAQMIGDITKMQVFQLRHTESISREDVLENRYKTWVKLINKGVSTEEIAEIYNLKEQSLRMALWRRNMISFVD